MRVSVVRVGIGTLLIILVIGALPPTRIAVLRMAGNVLVVDDPTSRAEAAILTTWAGEAGVLEVADLILSGISSRAVVIVTPPWPHEREFTERSVPYDDTATRLIRLLTASGVPPDRIDRLQTDQGGTEGESRAVVQWCNQQDLQTVIVVSTKDHSRRLRRTLHRLGNNMETRFLVRSVRHGAFDPDEWWRTRDGLRAGVIELQKLILDVVRHPLS